MDNKFIRISLTGGFVFFLIGIFSGADFGTSAVIGVGMFFTFALIIAPLVDLSNERFVRLIELEGEKQEDN